MEISEINVLQLEQKREAGESFVLLDVREPHEIAVANLGDWVEVVPMSQLARTGPAALPEALRNDRDQEIIVMCHHGGRSAQVTAWLQGNGWTNVTNLAGGIHAYSIHIDSSIPRY
ncbi:MAG: rhodanese-like domain-containing protein [Candidatus Promineifilaceae bacterium]